MSGSLNLEFLHLRHAHQLVDLPQDNMAVGRTHSAVGLRVGPVHHDFAQSDISGPGDDSCWECHACQTDQPS